MNERQIRPGVWIGVLVFLCGVGLVVELAPRRRPATAPAPAATETPMPSAPAPTDDSRSHERGPGAAAAEAPQSPEYVDGVVYGEIDLREARALMPDNLFWKLGVPTKDPAVLAEREAEKKKRDEQYGRVLAGDASEEDVRDYYEYRTRLSSDYLEFSEFMSRRFRDAKNEQFSRMLELATKMHADRLKLLPQELADALERSQEHARAREDWKRQQQEFGAAGGLPAGDDDAAQ